MCVCVCVCVCVCMLVTQLYLSLCNPVDCSPPGSSVHGIVQARTLEWLPFPPPGDLSDPGIEPASPVSRALQVDSLLLSHRGSPVLYRHINN